MPPAGWALGHEPGQVPLDRGMKALRLAAGDVPDRGETRLVDLAAVMADWAARNRDPEVPGTGDAADYISVQLMTADAAASSPAWRRLNDLASERL